MKNSIKYSQIFPFLALCILAFSCQKMTRPSMGDYPKDANPPGGPLKFFAAFDGNTSNTLMNAVDSIRANFPSDNPLTSVTGVSGQGVQGDGTKFIKYAAANDFSSHDSSFTIAFWEKRNGIPNGNASFVFTLSSANKQWGSYGFSMFALFDWGSWSPATKAKIKFYMVDDNCKCDNWFSWDSSRYISGKDTVQTDFVANVQDNNWHHIVITYSNEYMELYIDNQFISKTSNIFNINVRSTQYLLGYALGLGGKYWDGSIDDLRFYNRTLTASDVQKLYNL